MKTLITFIAAILLSANSYAFDVTGRGDYSVTGNLANETGLAYSRSFGVDPDQFGGKRISAIVTYSSVNFSAVAFSSQSYTTNTAPISITAHGLTSALPVLYTVTAGAAAPGLVDGTTYYVIPLTANSIELASTSVKAVALDPIILGVKSATGVYALTPLALTGTPSFKWQGSNDGTNMVDLAITSVTVSAFTVGGATVGFDFEWFDYTNLVLNVISPTTGAMQIKAILDMKY